MHLQYIEFLLNMPEIHVTKIDISTSTEIHVEVTPVQHVQPCPCCRSKEFVIRKGKKMRKIRHIDACEKKVYIHAPSISQFCKSCHFYFAWSYSFVAPKKQYTQAFEQKSFKEMCGSTSSYIAKIHHFPTSTAHLLYSINLTKNSEEIKQEVMNEALDSSNLVLAIDDFSIRKGHRYNTGIHDLRGENFLDVIQGRKLEELRKYVEANPKFLDLQPKVVVMDLAQTYHTWIKECFPAAIRIADRFHVSRYVIEALQEIRKEVQPTLQTKAKEQLKKHHRLLNPQFDRLTNEKQRIVKQLLNYSKILKAAYEWKESFQYWYDHSPKQIAELRFDRWLQQGKEIKHSAVDSCLNTMKNWKQEIINYHMYRFTNASVEGRHNKIKAFQRRHFFMRNRENYVNGIIVDCNLSKIA